MFFVVILSRAKDLCPFFPALPQPDASPSAQHDNIIKCLRMPHPSSHNLQNFPSGLVQASGGWFQAITFGLCHPEWREGSVSKAPSFGSA